MHHVEATRRLTDTSPTWGDDRSHAGISPPVTPVRHRPIHSRQDKAANHLSLYGTRSTPSRSPTISTTSQASDQPLSARNPPLTSWEPERSGHEVHVTARSSPSTKAHRGAKPGKPGLSDLHPDLKAVHFCESSLTKRGNKITNKVIARCLSFQTLSP